MDALEEEVRMVIQSKLANRAWRLAARVYPKSAIAGDPLVQHATMSKLQDVVIQHGTPEDAIYFASYVRDSDITLLQKVVLDYGDGWDAYRFARIADGADIPALQKIVLEHGDGNDLIAFAKDVPGADVLLIREKVAEKYGPAVAPHSDFLELFDKITGIRSNENTVDSTRRAASCKV